MACGDRVINNILKILTNESHRSLLWLLTHFSRMGYRKVCADGRGAWGIPYISATIKDSDTLPATNPMFSGFRNSMTLRGETSEVNRRRKQIQDGGH